MPKEITKFSGQFWFLSNFYPAEVKDDFGITYPSVEHAYQAAKSPRYSDRVMVSHASHPSKAKRMGRGFLRSNDWDAIKYSVMKELVWKKFSLHEELRLQLVGTGDMKLVEGNDWGDTYWGVCDGKGKNHLGRILMKVRKVLSTQVRGTRVMSKRCRLCKGEGDVVIDVYEQHGKKGREKRCGNRVGKNVKLCPRCKGGSAGRVRRKRKRLPKDRR